MEINLTFSSRFKCHTIHLVQSGHTSSLNKYLLFAHLSPLSINNNYFQIPVKVFFFVKSYLRSEAR